MEVVSRICKHADEQIQRKQQRDHEIRRPEHKVHRRAFRWEDLRTYKDTYKNTCIGQHLRARIQGHI